MSSDKRTDQKMASIRLVAAGLAPEEACERAGYARPKRAARRIFAVDENGDYTDDVVCAELAVDHAEDGFADVDVDDLPRAVLVSLLRDDSTPPHVLQRAATALQSVVERTHRTTNGAKCPTCGRGGDGNNAFRRSVEERVDEILG